MNISVLGNGAWGTALASLITHNGHQVTLWAHSQESAEEFEKKQLNCATVTTNLSQALDNPYVVITLPLLYLKETLEPFVSKYNKDMVFIIGSKGMDKQTLLFPYQLLESWGIECAVLSGPSFAKELVQNQPTAVMLATKNAQLYQTCKLIFEHDAFKLIPTRDFMGISCAGAYKNITALGTGILTGLGYGDNTKAWFLTRSLYELALIMQRMGAPKETLFSLAGIGDLVLTSYSTTSKNFTYGYLRAQLSTCDDWIPEGINSLESFYQWNQQHNLQLPLTTQLYEIIFNKEPAETLVDLLTSSDENNNQF